MIKSLKRNALYGLSGRGLQYLGQFVLILLLPKILLPETYLEFNLILPVAFLGSTALFGWMISSIYRYAHELHDPNHPEYRETVFFYYLSAIIVLTVVSISLTLSTDSPYALVPFLLMATALKNGINGILNAMERHREFFLSNAGFTFSLLALLLTCHMLDGQQLWAPILVYALLDILIGLLFWNRCGIFSTATTPTFHKTVALGFMSYGAPIVLNNVFTWIIALSDRYLLNFWELADHVATYVLTYQFAGSVITIPMAFIMTMMYPRILKINKEKGVAEAMIYVADGFKKFKRFSLPAGLLAVIIVTPFMTAFFTTYSIDPPLIAILILAHVVMSASHFVNKEFELNGRTIMISRALMIAALANVISNLILIPLFGTRGAGVATLVAYALMIFLVYRKNTFLRSNNSESRDES